MLKCVDRAMYEVKRKDRYCCVVWKMEIFYVLVVNLI